MSWAEVKYLLDNASGTSGLVPNKLSSLSAAAGTLTWKATNTTIEDQIVCEVGKIVFRYSADSAPATPNDGTLLYETTDLSGTYNYTLDDGVYISGFVYSSQGVLNDTPVTAQTVSFESFAKDTWKMIKKCSESGMAEQFYAVGDEKTVSINGTDYIVTIMDFNHDDLADGSGKAGITIGLKNCLTTTHNMNSSNTNSGGWESCAMRSWLQSTVLGWLPEELQAVIKKVNKKATAGSQSTTIKTSTDNLFLLAEVEIFGTKTYGSLDEGTQYSYFTTTSRRVKKSGDSGSATIWWERSPCTSGSGTFCYVGSSGSAYDGNASITSGVSFGFCI